jgi:hypothetical protein
MRKQEIYWTNTFTMLLEGARLQESREQAFFTAKWQR